MGRGGGQAPPTMDGDAAGGNGGWSVQQRSEMLGMFGIEGMWYGTRGGACPPYHQVAGGVACARGEVGAII